MTYEEAFECENAAASRADGIAEEIRGEVSRLVHHRTEALEAVEDTVHKRFEPKLTAPGHKVGVNVGMSRVEGRVVRAVPVKEVPEGASKGYKVCPPEVEEVYEVEVLGEGTAAHPGGSKMLTLEKQMVRVPHPASKTVVRMFIRQHFSRDTYPSAPWIASAALIERYGLAKDLPKDLQEIKDMHEEKRRKNRRSGQGPPEDFEALQRTLIKLKETPAEKEKRLQREMKERFARAALERASKKEAEEKVESLKRKIEETYPIEDQDLGPKDVLTEEDRLRPAEPPNACRDLLLLPQHLVGRALAQWDFCHRFSDIIRLSTFSWDDYQRSLLFVAPASTAGPNALFNAVTYALLQTAWPPAYGSYASSDADCTKAVRKFLQEMIVKPLKRKRDAEAVRQAEERERLQRQADQRAESKRLRAEQRKAERLAAGEQDLNDDNNDDDDAAEEDEDDDLLPPPAASKGKGGKPGASGGAAAAANEDEGSDDHNPDLEAEGEAADTVLAALNQLPVTRLHVEAKMALLDLLILRVLATEQLRKSLEAAERVVQDAKNTAREWLADARRRDRAARSKAWWAQRGGQPPSKAKSGAASASAGKMDVDAGPGSGSGDETADEEAPPEEEEEEEEDDGDGEDDEDDEDEDGDEDEEDEDEDEDGEEDGDEDGGEDGDEEGGEEDEDATASEDAVTKGGSGAKGRKGGKRGGGGGGGGGGKKGKGKGRGRSSKKHLPPQCPDVQAIEAKFSLRTEPLGYDRAWRAYYIFHGCPHTLFVCTRNEDGTASTWSYYDQPEAIPKLESFLNPKGVREKALLEALTPRKEPLIQAMIKNNADLIASLAALEVIGRRSARRPNEKPQAIITESHQRFVNKMRL
jgi:hypothetical protein